MQHTQKNTKKMTLVNKQKLSTLDKNPWKQTNPYSEIRKLITKLQSLKNCLLLSQLHKKIKSFPSSKFWGIYFQQFSNVYIRDIFWRPVQSVQTTQNKFEENIRTLIFECLTTPQSNPIIKPAIHFPIERFRIKGLLRRQRAKNFRFLKKFFLDAVEDE